MLMQRDAHFVVASLVSFTEGALCMKPRRPNRMAQISQRQERREIRRKKLQENPRCVYCSKRLMERTATLDHIVARSNGGTDDEANLVLACTACNLCKSNRSLSQWIADLARALNNTIPPIRRVC